MKKLNHGLVNREVDGDVGLIDVYSEFTNSDFDNEFDELENEDYRIRASQKVINNNKEESMKGTRLASYIDQLSSGYDATVQDDYEAGKGATGQMGKGHEEEVAKGDNWKGDKRDAIGRAASAQTLRRIAADLNKQADDMECEEDMDDLEESEIDENVESDDDMDIEAAAAEVKKEAAHPLEHSDKSDDPEADESSRTGDEWIDIGPGEFNDKRDEVNRAGKNE